MADKRSEKYRDRGHCLLLYPDCEAHVKALQIIERSYDYAYILHDRDIMENGELKKPHYHVLLRFPNATWSTKVCKDLGIQENYIEKPRSFNSALLYLIHFNDTDKTQYSVDEVKGSLKHRLVNEVNKIDKTESEKIIELLDFIDSMAEPITIAGFSRYCASMGYWSEFRRSGGIFMRAIDEHNMMLRGNENDYTESI